MKRNSRNKVLLAALAAGSVCVAAAAERGNRILYLRDGVICDEIELTPYNGPDRERHVALRTFLSNMGW